jgi:diguanylate cyclase (GGDEF)-like protein
LRFPLEFATGLAVGRGKHTAAATLVTLAGLAWSLAAHAEPRQHRASQALTTAAEVHESEAAQIPEARVHLTGTITYVDPAKGVLFLQDSTGGVYLHSGKAGSVAVGDSVLVDGVYSSARGEVDKEPEIVVVSKAGAESAARRPWLSLVHFVEIAIGLCLFAGGVGVWGAQLKRRVANQDAWIDRSMTIARERSRILELISANQDLEEVLREICISTKILLPGADCSFDLEGRRSLPQVEETNSAEGTNEAGESKPSVTLFETTLKDAEEKVVGKLMVTSHAGLAIHADSDEVYRVLSELSGLALRQSLLYRGLMYHSTHDPLTELPNRRLYESRLQEVLEEAQRTDGQMAVIYIDINRFKHVNDQYGHKVGDLYLQTIAARLRRQLRPDDMLARIGGDEFVAIAPFLEGFDRVFALTSRLQRCFADPFELDGVSIDGSASFGFARYPEHGTTAEELTRHADHAMYVAKHESRISDEAHGLAMITVSDLELAFFNYNYKLAYQPQFSANGRLAGMEALLRLDHPVHGLLTPESFISVAEQHPIILDIGSWVLRCAVQDAKLWQLDLGDEVRIAVNVSARQLEEPSYARSVLATLKQYDFPPQRLEIELIERSLMFSGEKVIEQLVQLRAAGVRISLDDFGTEQSCLSLLHKLPIDTVKLDRSFIRAMDNEPTVLPIVQAIVTMARALDKRVVAEAIEHTGPVPALLKMGKMDFQGYLLSRPVAGHLVPGLIQSWRAGIEMPDAFYDPSELAERSMRLREVPRMRTA